MSRIFVLYQLFCQYLLIVLYQQSCVGLLGSDIRLRNLHDVYLLSPQDHPGKLLYVDDLRAADVQRSVRRHSSVAATRTRRMRGCAEHLVGTEETGSGLGFA